MVPADITTKPSPGPCYEIILLMSLLHVSVKSKFAQKYFANNGGIYII